MGYADVAGVSHTLNRYELAGQGDQLFGALSGGQQARFLVLLLELAERPCCCSTSRPTTWTSPRLRRLRKG
jgi:hypothetical protein